MKTIHTLMLTTLATAMAAGTAFAQETTTPRTGQTQTPQTQPQTQQGQTQDQTRQGQTQDNTQHGQTQQDQWQTQQGQTGAQDHGQGHGMSDKPSYDELNVRRDGRVTRGDLDGHPRLLEKFDDIDTTDDGSISRAEFDAWKSQKDRDGAHR